MALVDRTGAHDVLFSLQEQMAKTGERYTLLVDSDGTPKACMLYQTKTYVRNTSTKQLLRKNACLSSEAYLNLREDACL